MKNRKDVKKDLLIIKNYYLCKDELQNAAKEIGEIKIMDIVELYKKIITTAKPKIYCYYYSYIVRNMRQETIATNWGYSIDYVKKMGSAMVDFILKEINKQQFRGITGCQKVMENA